MRLVALCLFSVVLTSVSTFAKEVTVTGKLREAKDKETKSTYFLIEVTKPITRNGTKTGRLQLAGLDQKAWDAALHLRGKQVKATGKLMEAHTRYHYTPLLLITDKVRPVK